MTLVAHAIAQDGSGFLFALCKFKSVLLPQVSIKAVQISLLCFDREKESLQSVNNFIYRELQVAGGQTFGNAVLIPLPSNTASFSVVLNTVVLSDGKGWRAPSSVPFKSEISDIDTADGIGEKSECPVAPKLLEEEKPNVPEYEIDDTYEIEIAPADSFIAESEYADAYESAPQYEDTYKTTVKTTKTKSEPIKSSSFIKNSNTFCVNCGKPVSVESHFCESCGDSVFKNTGFTYSSINLAKSTAVGIEHKPLTELQKRSILIGIIVLIFGITASSIIGYFTNPQRIAEKYFDSICSNDLKKQYAFLDVKNTGFTSESFFIKSRESEISDARPAILNYKISNNEPKISFGSALKSENSDDSLTKTFSISYIDTETTKERTTSVVLMKQKENFLFVFPLWKVGFNDVVSHNFNVNVPKGAKVSIDDVELSDDLILKYAEDDYDSYSNYGVNIKSFDTYVIPEIFTGTYNLKVSLPYAEVKEQKIEISDRNYTTITEFVLTEQAYSEICNTVISDIDIIYQAVIESKPFSEIAYIYSDDESVLRNAESAYNSLVENYNKNGNILKKFSVSLGKSEFSNIGINNSSVSLYVPFEYTYTLQVYKNSYSASSGTENYIPNSPKSSSESFQLIYKEGNWKLGSARMGLSISRY